jgi:hypothetical protein
VNSDAPSIVNLRTLLQSLANQDQIALDQNGLPSKRNSPVSPSKAFEILAEHDDARPSIESLHQHLKNNRVWLWQKGAIEPHLGLEGKGPAHWASFSDRLSRDGVEAVCADHQSIRELFDWIREQQ